MRTLFCLLTGILAFAAAGCSSIGRRLVLPGSFIKPPASTVAASPEYELAHLTTGDGSQTVVLFARARGADGKERIDWHECRTVVFCYGNGMSIAQSLPIVRDISSMGANVAVGEYPGYGMSPGVPSEEGCYSAAESAYEFVEQQQIEPSRVTAIGMSLGSSVALELATRRRVGGVVLVVPFTRTRDVGTDKLPWYIRWSSSLLTQKVQFDNLSKLPRVGAPVLIVSASRDQVSSAARTRELIAAGRKGQVTPIEVDADHDGAWSAGRTEIGRWLQQQAARPVAGSKQVKS